MDAKISHGPSFAVVVASLKPGETLTAEADAMASMSKNIEMKSRFSGGFFTAMKRSIFGGESMFVNDFSLESGEEGEVVLTQNAPGDITCVELSGGSFCLQPGAFIACTGDVGLSTKWAGFKSMLAKEGLFRLVVSGNGRVWIGAYGGIMEKQVKGEYIVDSGHIVAYALPLKLKLQMSGGIFSSFFSGEGLVTRVEGEGKIYMQTRSVSGLLSWINPRLP